MFYLKKRILASSGSVCVASEKDWVVDSASHFMSDPLASRSAVCLSLTVPLKRRRSLLERIIKGYFNIFIFMQWTGHFKLASF